MVKCYSLDEHLRIPDFLVISKTAMDKLTDEQIAIIKEAAVNATQAQKKVWNEAVDEAMQQIGEMGVTVVTPDKAPFQEKVAPLIEEYKQDPAIGQLVDAIQNAQ